ncbi:flavin reductase family protein [Micromonospora sp. WMMD712]|uniref:flavin reductase family protein n=1 Tax=Micromonospora sp. WMMD712 TaxID=3016096 RepID=UPI00249A7698|nr:flavin reductase family protein [Micromonospora sp. WMMD712]WFE58739.1 flavin reductase family protein [Micromonospora sp. WMMD712]
MTTTVPHRATTERDRAVPAGGPEPDRAAPVGPGPDRVVPVGGPELREFMRNWATGVAVVTSRAAGHPVGCTVNAFTSVSLRPPLLLVSLARTSRTLAAITAEGGFAVNLLGRRQRALADRFATGVVEDRFAGVAYRALDGMPLLDGAMAAAVCAVTQLIAAADHVLVLGAPYWCEATGDADPAVFLGGRYRTVSPA